MVEHIDISVIPIYLSNIWVFGAQIFPQTKVEIRFLLKILTSSTVSYRRTWVFLQKTIDPLLIQRSKVTLKESIIIIFFESVTNIPPKSFFVIPLFLN